MTSSTKQRRLAALINEAATKSADGAAWCERMDRWLDEQNAYDVPLWAEKRIDDFIDLLTIHR